MKWLQDHEVAINLSLFKRYRFFHIFNPNGSKILSYDKYKFANVIFILVITGYNIFSATCFFTDTMDTVDYVELLLLVFIYTIIVISLLKISVLLFNADRIWDLFDLTRLDFLTSRRCRDSVEILHKYRDRSTMITDLYQNYSTGVFIIWMIVPLVLNTFVMTEPSADQRYHNIFNMQYPVTATVYNRYYYMFYLMEIAMGIFVLNYSMIIDNFLISLCWAIIGQYEVITTAFGSIGNDRKLETFENGKSLGSGMYQGVNAHLTLPSRTFEHAQHILYTHVPIPIFAIIIYTLGDYFFEVRLKIFLILKEGFVMVIFFQISLSLSTMQKMIFFVKFN